MMVDERFNYVSSSSGFEQVGDDQVYTTHTRTDIPVTKNGYLYIYVSNETPNIDVFFDNLQVTHVRGPMLEETHYYLVFGLTMAGISSKALAFGGAENKYKFNDGTELASKEFSDGSGLEMYETPFRGYDPQIGRFWQIDGMAYDYEGWAPYSFSFNNPVFFNDPSGLDPEGPDNVKTLPGVTVKASYKNNQNYFYWTSFADANKRHDVVAVTNYLKNQGVNDRGLTLFNKAWAAIGYRQRLAEIDAAWKKFLEAAFWEGVKWYAGGVVFKLGGKAISLGYRAYKLNKARQVAKEAQYLYHYTSEAGVKSIMETGMTITEKRPLLFLTNSSNLSPLQAQIELALPTSGGLPTSILRINATGIDPVLIRRVTGNLPGMGAGGGTEFLFNQNIPSSLIQIIK